MCRLHESRQPVIVIAGGIRLQLHAQVEEHVGPFVPEGVHIFLACCQLAFLPAYALQRAVRFQHAGGKIAEGHAQSRGGVPSQPGHEPGCVLKGVGNVFSHSGSGEAVKDDLLHLIALVKTVKPAVKIFLQPVHFDIFPGFERGARVIRAAGMHGIIQNVLRKISKLPVIISCFT